MFLNFSLCMTKKKLVYLLRGFKNIKYANMIVQSVITSLGDRALHL